MKTLRETYNELRNYWLKSYKGHYMDMYEGHNHIQRDATKYAIKNTINTWQKQYEN